LVKPTVFGLPNFHQTKNDDFRRALINVVPLPNLAPCWIIASLTPHITGSKKQSEERAALFAVRVYVIVMFFYSQPSLTDSSTYGFQ